MTPWEAEIDRLMRQQMTTLDHAHRKQLYDRVQQIAAENLPIICLASPDILVAARKNLGNFQPAAVDHYTLWNSEQLYWRQPAGVRTRRRDDSVSRDEEAETRRTRPVAASDEQLVAECLRGDQQAWAALVEKYETWCIRSR